VTYCKCDILLKAVSVTNSAKHPKQFPTPLPSIFQPFAIHGATHASALNFSNMLRVAVHVQHLEMDFCFDTAA